MSQATKTRVNDTSQTAPGWIKPVLRLAGIYNLVWGAWVILFPDAYFNWLKMELPRYPEIWQCVGMVVGVFGVGYWIAANDPRRHWPIVLVGFLGKVFGPIGFLYAVWQGNLPWAFGLTNITNDLIWLIPFALILFDALSYHSQPDKGERLPLKEALSRAVSQKGKTLKALNQEGPVLVMFIRHAGCVFCREALADLSKERNTFESQGVTLAVVHMSSPEEAAELFARYDLDDIHQFSDPTCQLYRSFGLARGSITQLLGPKIWWRGFLAWIRGNGFSSIQGDGFQLGGAFLLNNGQIAESQLAANAAERLDLAQMACAAGSCRLPEASNETQSTAV